MIEADLQKILPQLPQAIRDLYTQLRSLNCPHKEAYQRTFRVAKELGWTGSCAGLPAHEGPKRLLLQSEIMNKEFFPKI